MPCCCTKTLFIGCVSGCTAAGEIPTGLTAAKEGIYSFLVTSPRKNLNLQKEFGIGDDLNIPAYQPMDGASYTVQIVDPDGVTVTSEQGHDCFTYVYNAFQTQMV